MNIRTIQILTVIWAVIWAVILLSLLGALVWVAAHFIAKVW